MNSLDYFHLIEDYISKRKGRDILQTKIIEVNPLSISSDLNDFFKKKFEKQTDFHKQSFAVHSIYRNVINLREENGIFFSIAKPEAGEAPMTLRIDYKKSFKELDLYQDVHYKDSILKLSDELSIDLAQNYKIWQVRGDKKVKVNTDRLDENKLLFAELLAESGVSGGLKYFYLKHFTDQKSVSSTRIERYLAEKTAEVVLTDSAFKDFSKIIGLGIGSTPSADDFITGYLGVMYLADNKLAEEVFEQAKEVIKLEEVSTTDLSRIMLSNLLQKKVKKINIDFSKAVNENGSTFKRKFKELLKVGSSSGTDTAVGIMTAYQQLRKYL